VAERRGAPVLPTCAEHLGKATSPTTSSSPALTLELMLPLWPSTLQPEGTEASAWPARFQTAGHERSGCCTGMHCAYMTSLRLSLAT
jgi:hypothetical protein